MEKPLDREVCEENDYEKLKQEREFLQSLNRSGMKNLILESDSPIYVIGHRSPDTDTVCSALAYAELLRQLGYDASARITMRINNETKYVLKQANVDVPEELPDASGLNIVLVDHSEYLQAAEGMKDAHIVGVIDHHGVGSITTGYQLLYEAKPIGCTSTIILMDYLNCGLEINPTTAFLMLCAILSDTTNLTGSTTTEADKQAVAYLSDIAQVKDVNPLFEKMYAHSLSYTGMTDRQILFSDYKEYDASGYRFGIGCINAKDEDKAMDLAKRVHAVLPRAIKVRGINYMYAAVRVEGDGKKIDFIVPADENSKIVFEETFPDFELDDDVYVMRKSLGRKSKFVPGLTEYLAARPHE